MNNFGHKVPGVRWGGGAAAHRFNCCEAGSKARKFSSNLSHPYRHFYANSLHLSFSFWHFFLFCYLKISATRKVQI